MALNNYLTKAVIFLMFLGIVYALYFVFVKYTPEASATIVRNYFSSIFNKLRNEEVSQEVLEQPVEVKDKIVSSASDLEFMLDYARAHNIAIPEEILKLIRDGDNFVAAAKTKQYMTKQVVGWKDLIMVQVIYQEGSDEATSLLKQKVYTNLSKLEANVKNGAGIDAQINILKSSFDPSLVAVQKIFDYDCSKDTFIDFGELKSSVDKLNKGEFSSIYDRNGYSYIVVYASNANNSSYCSLDEFIKAYKR